MLVRPDESGVYLAVISLDGQEKTVIAKKDGAGIMMRSWWSPNQRFIAFSVVTGVDDPANGLYLYDMLSGQSSQIAVDVHDPDVAFAPSADKLSMAYFTPQGFTSRVIHLKA